MKLLLDMNRSPQWVDALADAGWKAVHWSTIGRPDASDRDIMDAARSGGYIVITHDLDFGILLAISQEDGPSVVQLQDQDILPTASRAALIQALKQCQDELQAGALLTIDAARFRVTSLPLKRQ